MFLADTSLASFHSDLIMSVHRGVVTLHGYTPTRRESRRIAERIEQLPGVVRVVNEATVSWNQ